MEQKGPIQCKLCKHFINDEEDTVTLRKLGADGVNAASKTKNDDIEVIEGDMVHVVCRKEYVKKRKSSEIQNAQTSSTRSASSFDFKSRCYLCGNVVTRR